MKITKRRVKKRNRIKRKYSKKRTKTRQRRKRVFSKKRRKTIKKKKRGGGEKRTADGKPKKDSDTSDTVFNFVHRKSSSDDGSSSDVSQELGEGWMHNSIAEIAAEIAAEKENSRKKLKNEKSPVLLITTHGAVTFEKFEVPFNIKKLNATPFGCVNYLSSAKANKLGKEILKSINNTSNDSDLATEIKKHMDTITRSTKENISKLPEKDLDTHLYLNLPAEGHNKIHPFKESREIFNTEFITYNNESVDENPTPYNNSIMLLQENHTPIDLIREILPRRAPRLEENGENVLMLSKVLNHLNSDKFKDKYKFEISSLIIVDLACSSILSDDRSKRKYNKINLKHNLRKYLHGGNYNYKKTKTIKRRKNN